MQAKIIGIGGTNGAGKDTVGHVLADNFGFVFVSGSDLLRQEAKRRGMVVDRLALRTISTEWRKEYGLGVLIDRAIAQAGDQINQVSGVAIASLRNAGEADHIHKLGGIILWLDAEPHVRYDRIRLNADKRNRTAEDNQTFGQFLAEEQIEMHSNGDEASLDASAVRERADFTIINNFDDRQALVAEISKQLGLGIHS